MAKFTKKPVTVEAITFQELVDHGRRVAPESINGGMPWSFTYGGHHISHENDACYLIPTLEGTMKMGPGDMLITGVKGEIYPCKRDIFEANYGTALPVIDPGPDSLERAMESKTYQDGTTAFGPAPLPDVSPALWAKPLAKEVPELTVSLSDLGLEREIQANSHHSGCKGERCMASAANGYAHSRECIDEAGEAQGWTPTAEDYAKCGPSAGCCGAAPTDSHASAVLYPAIERAMSELGTLHPAFNFAVNRAFNHLHDAFWSECPAPASAAPKRPNFPGV